MPLQFLHRATLAFALSLWAILPPEMALASRPDLPFQPDPAFDPTSHLESFSCELKLSKKTFAPFAHGAKASSNKSQGRIFLRRLPELPVYFYGPHTFPLGSFQDVSNLIRQTVSDIQTDPELFFRAISSPLSPDDLKRFQKGMTQDGVPIERQEVLLEMLNQSFHANFFFQNMNRLLILAHCTDEFLASRPTWPIRESIVDTATAALDAKKDWVFRPEAFQLLTEYFELLHSLQRKYRKQAFYRSHFISPLAPMTAGLMVFHFFPFSEYKSWAEKNTDPAAIPQLPISRLPLPHHRIDEAARYVLFELNGTLQRTRSQPNPSEAFLKFTQSTITSISQALAYYFEFHGARGRANHFFSHAQARAPNPATELQDSPPAAEGSELSSEEETANHAAAIEAQEQAPVHDQGPAPEPALTQEVDQAQGLDSDGKNDELPKVKIKTRPKPGDLEAYIKRLDESARYARSSNAGESGAAGAQPEEEAHTGPRSSKTQIHFLPRAERHLEKLKTGAQYQSAYKRFLRWTQMVESLGFWNAHRETEYALFRDHKLHPVGRSVTLSRGERIVFEANEDGSIITIQDVIFSHEYEY